MSTATHWPPSSFSRPAASGRRWPFPIISSVGARVARVDEDRFVMFYAVYSHRLQKIAAEGEGTIVCFDYRENRKALLPAELRRKISEVGKFGGTGQGLRSSRIIVLRPPPTAGQIHFFKTVWMSSSCRQKVYLRR